MQKKPDGNFILIAASIMVLSAASILLYRPLWFDEALTLMNFVHNKSLTEIYNDYLIPNNQIIYTATLAIWTRITAFFDLNYDFGARLLSMIYSVISIIALYCGFKNETGGKRGILLILFAVFQSVPFLLYGTAVRGYQLSFMLLILLAWSVKNICCKVTWRNITAYSLLSLLLTGTIPTNLLGIGMTVGLFMPELWGKWKRIAALAVIPFVMFALFYLPIWDKFIKVCNLGEGLSGRFAAAIVPYAAFLLNYSIIVIIGIWGWAAACQKRKIRYKNLFRPAAILLWLIPCFVLKAAPFYRVFYPCFALLIIFCAMGVKHWIFLFLRKLPEVAQRAVLFVIAVLILGNFFLMKSDFAARKIQHFFKLSPMEDDYFQPYYFRDDFYPPAVINKINREYIRDVKMVFLTFEADSRALYFYAVYGNADSSKYILDGPKFKVEFLPYNSLIVLPENGNPDQYIKRFNLQNRRINKLFTEGFHSVWEIK